MSGHRWRPSRPFNAALLGILIAAVVALTNADFQDSAGAGVAAPFTGTSLGDVLGNSGITFTGAVTRYWVAVAGGNWDATSSWAASSGGASGASVPLIHDDVVFDASSITSGGQTVAANMVRLARNISTSGLLNSPTFQNGSNGGGVTWYTGSLSFQGFGAVTVSGASSMICMARSAVTIATAGLTMPFSPFQISCVGGSVAQLDAYSGGRLTVSDGTWITSGFAATLVYVNIATTTRTRGAQLGSSLITLTGTDSSGSPPWNAGSATGLTVDAGTSTIKFTDVSGTAKTFNGAGKTYNNVWFSGVSLSQFSITGSNSFNEVKVDPGNVLLLQAATIQTVASLTASGNAPGGSDAAVGRLFGIVGCFFSTPDSAANSITGDIDVRARAAAVDWTSAGSGSFMAKRVDGGSQQSWDFAHTTTGALTFGWSLTGSGMAYATSSVVTGFADGAVHYVRATRSAATGDIKFYTSPDGVVWTQLGATRTSTVGALFDSNAAIEVGAHRVANGSLFVGTIYRAQLLNGIDGPVVVDFNPASHVSGATWASETGEVWTTNGNALISATNKVAIGSLTAVGHTIAKNGGERVQLNHASINRSTASAANTFYAANSTNGGNNVNWVFGGYIEAGAGAYALAGQNAGLLAHRRLPLEAGAYVMSGQDAAMVVGRRHGHHKFIVAKDANVFVVMKDTNVFVVDKRQ